MDVLDQLPWKSASSLPLMSKDETMVRSAHRHWMKRLPAAGAYALLLLLCIAVLATGMALHGASMRVSEGVMLAGLLAAVLVQHWFFHFLLSENVTDIILTNKRILFLTRKLWFVDTADEIVLAKIKMVEAQKRGILCRVLDYGNLWFDTGGGRSIAFLPSPKEWARDIERHMR